MYLKNKMVHGKKVALILIFSVEGNLIKQYQGEKLPNDRKILIPVDYLPPGVYFINIDSGDKTETLKLLKR